MRRTLSLVFLLCYFSTSIAADSYHLTVAADGTADFTSIQEAINATKAFPPQRITIFVKNGIYREKVKVHSWNTKLTLIGESAEKTIVSYDDYFERINLGRNSTFHTWTMLVEANDFTLENITVMNIAGPVGQAVALHVEADRCTFRNVKIIGHQDALYAAGENSRQYYKNCYIEGTTDFIFGSSTALFDSCTVHSKSNSYITAASTPHGVKFGFVFRHCRFTATEGVEKVYLGRPWRKYAKTVLINCELGKHIVPEGWKKWDNADDLNTTYYAEYSNSGPGADTSGRIEWSHQLSENEAMEYTIKNIFNLSDNTSTDFWHLHFNEK
jgi:pectinesterase